MAPSGPTVELVSSADRIHWYSEEQDQRNDRHATCQAEVDLGRTVLQRYPVLGVLQRYTRRCNSASSQGARWSQEIVFFFLFLIEGD